MVKHFLLVFWMCVAALAMGIASAEGAAPQGHLVLPAKAVVFGPFAREDGVPSVELLRQVPTTLVIGDKRIEARTARFDGNRRLDLAPFTGPAIGGTAWVHITFTAEASEAVSFGFGADWWYEAYLDGKLISETLSQGQAGNGVWPPSIRDFGATVDMSKGDHVLAIRMLRGKGSAMLAVGGPEDLRNAAITGVARPKVAQVAKAGYREGPPAGKKWKMVWNDEFEGDAIDTGKWNIQSQEKWEWPGMKTKEAKENLFLDGKGALVLQLTKDPDGTVRYAKGMISRFSAAYGYFEARLQFTRQPGWWTGFWLAGVPYDCGVDAFVHSQEFDIQEDFYKPKKKNDISHCYHCSVKLAVLSGDQGAAKEVGEGSMIGRNQLGRTSSGQTTAMEQYDGWHLVGFEWTPLEHIWYVDGQETYRQTYREVPITNVPQHVWITGEYRTPATREETPFYGRLEDAKLPDVLRVDYARVWAEDPGGRRAPQVTLSAREPGPFKPGESVTFDVSAAGAQVKIESVLLFSMGRLRAEKKVDAAAINTSFTLDNLFPAVTNTVIAMARDSSGLVGQSAPLRIQLVTGREFTGTPYQGNPQSIPGTVKGGCYDEGGNGVAYDSASVGPSDPRLEFRKTELGALPEAVEVGGSYAKWITYEVEVSEERDFDVELYANRPDYWKKQSPDLAIRNETIRLNLGKSGSAGTTLAKWEISTGWDSGPGWRVPQKSLGKQRVHLPAGRHKLVLFCDDIHVPYTFLCRMVFVAVNQ
jgi:beta-glucanase (GH16 family)